MIVTLLLAVATFWMATFVITLAMVGLDERAHRRQAAAPAPVREAAPVRTAPRSLTLSKS